MLLMLLPQFARGAQGLVDDGSRAAFRGRQVRIPARQGETIGFANRVQHLHVHVEIQILHQSSNDGALARVLLTKVGRGRFDNVKEFGHDRGHPPKVTGTGATFRRVIKALVWVIGSESVC